MWTVYYLAVALACEAYSEFAFPPSFAHLFNHKAGKIHWTCPLECDCEEIADEGVDAELIVTCYRGNLNHDAFLKIIKEVPKNITTLIVEAPVGSSNQFLWDDNLNRFKNLRILRLINCNIPALSHSISLRVLEVLDLRLNNIEYLSIDMFADLPKLKHLDLSRNNLRVLPTGVFTFLRHLESLSLAYNDITELPTNLLHGQHQFKALHLDGTKIPIKNLNNFIRDTTQLERLELNNCEIDHVEDLQFSYLTNLRRLGLAGNDIGHVPTLVLRSLSKLSTVDLSNNNIREIYADPLWHSNITRLFLSYNYLGNAQTLQNIESYGPIQELDISHNHFDTFDAKFLGAARKTLEVLNLSGNRIRYIDGRLTRNLTALKALHIAEAEISELPSTFPPEYSQLTFLNVSGNKIYSLPSYSEEIFPYLKQLDISRNRFYMLSASVIENFIDRLDKVYLYGNPWDCGCNVDMLRTHMRGRYRQKTELRYGDTKCATPESLKGTAIYNLNHITDCAVLFGARYGFTQATELGVLVALLLGVSLFASLIILFAYYRRERKQKISYIDAHRSHSRTALTLSQHISRSPSSVIEPLTSGDQSSSATPGVSTKIPPPPPPPIVTNY